MPSDTRAAETHVLFRGEQNLVYCFSLANDPAVTAGATLSNPTISASPNTKVTLGSPVINATDFNQFDENGDIMRTVPAGKGVIFTITPIAQGQCTVTVLTQASDGQAPGGQVIFVVK